MSSNGVEYFFEELEKEAFLKAVKTLWKAGKSVGSMGFAALTPAFAIQGGLSEAKKVGKPFSFASKSGLL